MLKIRVIPGKYWVPCSKGFSLDSVVLPAGEIELSAESASLVKNHPDWDLLVSLGAIEILSESAPVETQQSGRKKKEVAETEA